MVGWLRSSIGKKVLMAASGMLLLGFVIAHLAGNLLIYAGPNALNAYAKKLRDLGGLLWMARAGLLLAVVGHVWTSVQLSLENRRARPVSYRRQQFMTTTWMARTMLFSGALFVAYVVYHLLHFTFGLTHPAISHAVDSLGRHDVYRMVVLSFQQWPIVVAYILGVAALCLHLSHGIGSAFQTLGVNNERTLVFWERFGQLLSAALFLGYISIPLSVLTGLVIWQGR